jgi:hypothetical protein
MGQNLKRRIPFYEIHCLVTNRHLHIAGRYRRLAGPQFSTVGLFRISNSQLRGSVNLCIRRHTGHHDGIFVTFTIERSQLSFSGTFSSSSVQQAGAPGPLDLDFIWCHQDHRLRCCRVSTMRRILSFTGDLIVALGFVASFANGFILGLTTINPYIYS